MRTRMKTKVRMEMAPTSTTPMSHVRGPHATNNLPSDPQWVIRDMNIRAVRDNMGKRTQNTESQL